MSQLSDKLKPVSEKHSIKEAVLTVFLASNIMKPKDYEQLINEKLANHFQQFETLNQTQIKIEKQNLTVQQQNDAGFKFVGFNSGKPSKVLRGLNDEDNRYFFSFHIFGYTCWSSFKQEFISFLQILDEFRPGSFIQAYSLLYLDEFNWINKNEYSSDCLFDQSSKFLPKDFFNSNNIVYNINMEKELDGEKYSDRLDIVIADKLLNKNIVVSHNQTFMLSEITKLTDLINDTNFGSKLNKAHDNNKELLKNILTSDVCEKININ